MKNKKVDSSCSDVQELPSKKMGRPLLIEEGPDKQVQEYVKYYILREIHLVLVCSLMCKTKTHKS